ncbi:MAG: hypothetical protein IKL00_01595, partial [Oscillospiraceae bacterium]|nr:hypothetical protein [Oscillospiraceae bacterium]
AEEELEISQEHEFVVDGSTRLEDFNEMVGTELYCEEVDTIAGYILVKLGNFPVEGQELETDGLRIVVEEMDKRRIEKVHIYTDRNPFDAVIGIADADVFILRLLVDDRTVQLGVSGRMQKEFHGNCIKSTQYVRICISEPSDEDTQAVPHFGIFVCNFYFSCRYIEVILTANDRNRNICYCFMIGCPDGFECIFPRSGILLMGIRSDQLLIGIG